MVRAVNAADEEILQQFRWQVLIGVQQSGLRVLPIIAEVNVRERHSAL